MKFRCEKSVLQDALTNCARAVPGHATIDVLKGVMIEAGDGTLTLTGNNMEMAIIVRMDAEVSEGGKYVLECKMFLDIVRKLPADTVNVEVDDRFVASITCGLSDFALTALPCDNFPPIPEVAGMRELTLRQSVLARQLSGTLFATAESEAKLIHTGALFDCEPGHLTVVALDGHRLALRREPAENEEAFSFVVPGNPLREIEKMLSGDEEETVALHIGSRHILFDMGQITLVTRLLEGEFLKYRNAIPAAREFRAVADLRELTLSVDRVSLLISDKLKNPIKLRFEDNRVVSSTVTAIGRATDTCPCTCEGTLEIGFNNRYLTDALRHLDGSEVRIECSGPLSPCLFLPPEDEDTVYMVLPVRLKADA